MYQVEVFRTYAQTKIKWLLPLAMLALLVWTQVSPIVVSAYAGLGGYISEKMLAGASIDSLYLSRTGGGPLVVASAPVISTGGATGIAWAGAATTATLHGTLSSLNGLPQATYYFQWGYAPGALTNSTPAVTSAALGEKTATILHFDPGVANVYYRFVAGTDGTSYGSVQSFGGGPATGGAGAGYFLLWNILTLIVAAGICISALLMFIHNPIAGIGIVVFGLVTIAIIRALLGLSIW